MSEEAIFPAVARERAGKGAARATRRSGLVPAVVYGDTKDPQMIAIEPRELMKQLVGGHFYNTIYTIKVEGGKDEKALPRDVQFHPVTDDPMHVDFMRLRKGARINVNIPVVFINEETCPGIEEGGTLTIVREEVELYCPVDAIPTEVTCDLANVQLDETIRISGVTLPEGVEPVIQDRDFVVANVAMQILAEITEEDDDDGIERDEDLEEGEEGEESSGEEAEGGDDS